MVVYINRTGSSLRFNGSSAESFAFEGVLNQVFGENNWKDEQDFKTMVYQIRNHSEYEIHVIMKTVEIAAQGKIKYAK
jgi:hypothetical protein